MNNNIKSLDQLSDAFLGKEPGIAHQLALKLQRIKVNTEQILLSTPIIRETVAIYNILVSEDRKIAFEVSRDSMAQNNAVSHIHDMIQNGELEKLIKEHSRRNNLLHEYYLESYDKLLEELKGFNLPRLCPNTNNLIDQVKTQLRQNKRFIDGENTSTLQNLIINYQQLLQVRKYINAFFITLKHANNKRTS